MLPTIKRQKEEEEKEEEEEEEKEEEEEGSERRLRGVSMSPSSNHKSVATGKLTSDSVRMLP